MSKNVIVLEQAPVINYDIVEQKGKEIEKRISSLNLDKIEPSEANLKLMKSTRSELSREFKTFEEQRKMVKDLIMRPYLEFEAKYKESIADKFEKVNLLLKIKVDTVEDGLLKEKIGRINAYFKETNNYDFLKLADLNLNIIRSKSDKYYKDQIDAYLEVVAMDMNAIETMDNSDRILAKYHIYKDMNRAVTEVQVEVQREKEIAERKAAQEKSKVEAEERRKDEEAAYVEQASQGQISEPEQSHTQPEAPKLYRASFTVTATKEQIAQLKKYMNEKGIRYE